MGPHSSEQGNQRLPDGTGPTSSGFNGASLFRARKPLMDAVRKFETRTASMGPHSSEQGNRPLEGDLREIVGLQWGLTLPSKETRIHSRRDFDIPGFNGASLFRARKLEGCSRRACWRSVLQWGLTLPSKETPYSHAGFVAHISGFNGASLFRARKQWKAVVARMLEERASMGPHSSEQGNQPQQDQGQQRGIVSLQWGLTLPSKETVLFRYMP